ncbi:MAG: hypothetical protein JNM98_06050 [Rhodocyclaceae bacterium]|nr:hypothetical protein [Rhodocyclaceae bacterium]
MSLNISVPLTPELVRRLEQYGFHTFNGIPRVVDASAAQSVLDAWTPADAAAEKCAQVWDHAAALFEALTSGYSATEKSSWSEIERQARVWLATRIDGQAPWCVQEAQYRSRPAAPVTIEQIALRVVAGADRLSALRPIIAGVRGRHCDAINGLAAVGDFDGIYEYDYSTGWPT